VKRWQDIRAAAPVDEAPVDVHRARLEARVRAYRLAQMRKRQALTQEQVAAEMGVRQPRVSQIERGELDRVELSTIRAYVAALGGRVNLWLTSVTNAW
jgi:predicted XRE-type DNA-binding protein